MKNDYTVYILCLACCALPIHALTAEHGNFSISDVGVRVGFDGDTRVELNSYEVSLSIQTPWSLLEKEDIRAKVQIELGAGALHGEDETGWFGHVGPAIEIEFGDFPVSFYASSGPAVLSVYEFDTLDLGGTFQFMSSGGFNVKLSEQWTAAYRFQHISNADIHDSNPGLDLHAVSISWGF